MTQAGDIAATEAFVVNEPRKQAGWSELTPTLYHYRDQRGREDVDLVIETPDGRVVAIEVKATQTVNDRDVHHLIRLRDRLETLGLTQSDDERHDRHG